MDLRSPVGSALSDAFLRLNNRHPWSHNDHFHGWILTHLPAQRGRALEVGCGRGELAAQLAKRFDEVVADDVDAPMREATARRCAGLSNVTVTGASLAELDGPFDLVTMVAVLHHLDVEPALVRVADLLAPGGKFLCVGMARLDGAVDLAWDVASIITNPVIGWVKHPWVNREPRAGEPFPVKDPAVSVAQLRQALAVTMPGARVRHHLGFRHTIEWQKPAPAGVRR